jgi:hypothetical protein
MSKFLKTYSKESVSLSISVFQNLPSAGTSQILGERGEKEKPASEKERDETNLNEIFIQL